MKPIAWLGILLIVLGALALAYQGFTYTHQEKVLDVGPIHATSEKQATFPYRQFSARSRWRAESRCLPSEPEKRL